MGQKMLRWPALLMMVFMIFAVGCSDDDGGTGPGTTIDEFAAITTAGDAYFGTYSGVNTTAAAVYTNMTDGDTSNDYYIIDWRSSAAYANAHIEGAVNMVLADLVTEIDTLPTDRTILNVCYTGQSASTATAVINLIGEETGHHAVNLVFGMSGWTSDTSYAGTDYSTKLSNALDGEFVTTAASWHAPVAFPTIDTGETTAEAVLKARAAAYLTPGWKGIMAGDLYADPDYDQWYIINYFPNTEYNAGHLPGARQYVPTQDILSTAALNTLPTDQKIAVYCWTGQTSAQVTAYLNMLGYDAYSVKFGVQNMCYTNGSVNTHAYSVPTTDYPVVGAGVS